MPNNLVKNMNLRVDPKTLKRIESAAATEGRTVTNFVRRCVELELNRMESHETRNQSTDKK